MYKFLIRPVFFLFDPEKIHNVTFFLLKILHKIPGVGLLFKSLFFYKNKSLEREVFGLKFPNPVGLAAGFDKDAKLVDELATLGFGFIEIGTLTPKAQSGNDKPRLFRVKKDEGIINRMGFNNGGVAAAVNRLRKRNSKVLIGGNIGKNKITSNDDAERDYELCFEALYDVVDYFVVNVSSPNTPNLRALQDKEPLKNLLERLQKRNKTKTTEKPILLKIAPDLTNEQLNDIIEIAQEIKLDGLIATNTTISRDALKTSKVKIEEIGAGGLSGKPLTDRSTEVIAYLRKALGADFPIIGVGGIMNEQDAIDKLNAGATLIQIYSGFIYEGPGLVKRINKRLVDV
ncbi:MAG: quinone-dependent dihydroorotate dehydrogenase [Cyclobacteriaceae bacterium]|nr:quinone-dependent dihydroorotate dehydrogenase [Cyclobacteriaceae bacterium]